MSRTVAVVLDDDHRFWAYDVSLAILAVEVLRVAEATDLTGDLWDNFRHDLRMAVILQGVLGLEVPGGLTDQQREQLLNLLGITLGSTTSRLARSPRVLIRPPRNALRHFSLRITLKTFVHWWPENPLPQHRQHGASVGCG